MKNAIMSVLHFLNDPPWLICCFIVILFYIEIEWLLMRNLATTLLLNSQFSGKFQRFNAIDGSIKMVKNSSNFKNFS